MFLHNDSEQMDVGGSPVDGGLEVTAGGASQDDNLPHLRIPRYLHAMYACKKIYTHKCFLKYT